MKSRNYTAAFLLAAFLLPASAFAKDKTDAKINLLYKTQVGTADHVQVNMLQHGKIVATAPAKLVANPKPAQSTAVRYLTVGDKVTVEAIDLSHSAQSLVFTDTQSQLATK